MITRKRPRELHSDDFECSSKSEYNSSSESVEETQCSTEESDQEHEELSSEPCAFTRRRKKAKTKDLYLKGKSRKPYCKGKDLSSSFEDTDLPQDISPGPSNPAMTAHFEPSEWNNNVCKSCAPVLIKYCETFKGMKRQGSELKRRKLINPHPKQPDKEQYRALVKQNEWLRNNVFDSLGNYIFCSRCVHHALGVSYQRLSRQRSIKRRESTEPIRSMTKSGVEEERLGEWVIMPPECEMSFMAWWKQLSNDSTVNVRCQHHRHGNSGKASHAAKKEAKSDFLKNTRNCRVFDSGAA